MLISVNFGYSTPVLVSISEKVVAAAKEPRTAHSGNEENDLLPFFPPVDCAYGFPILTS